MPILVAREGCVGAAPVLSNLVVVPEVNPLSYSNIVNCSHSQSHTASLTRPASHAQPHTPSLTRPVSHGQSHTASLTRPASHGQSHTASLTRPVSHKQSHTAISSHCQPHTASLTLTGLVLATVASKTLLFVPLIEST